MYHVLLEGRRVGPFDRRTIVGMCIRKALGRGDVVVDAQGREATVRDLVRGARAASPSHSVVQGIHVATLAEVRGDACCAVPPFSGALEVRLQTRALRIEGARRDGLAWKQDRLKIPLEQVVHAAVRGRLVDLGLQASPGGALQRLTLDLMSPDAAGEFAGALPNVTAWPASASLPVKSGPARAAPGHLMAWAGAAGITVLVAIVVLAVWLFTRR